MARTRDIKQKNSIGDYYNYDQVYVRNYTNVNNILNVKNVERIKYVTAPTTTTTVCDLPEFT